jgi:hypothetical protein
VTGWVRRASAAALVGVVVLLGGVGCGAADSRDPALAPATAPPRATRAPGPAPAGVPPVTAGPTVQEIAAALDAIHPTRHPRDNTATCAAKADCLGLVTTGAVSIYQWPTVSAAARFIGEAGNADRIGAYVLSYRTREQRSTPPEVRRAYADRLREMVGPAP